MLLSLKVIYLLNEFIDLKKGTRPRDIQKRKQAKKDIVESIDALHEDREMVLNAFRSGIFQLQQQKVQVI